MILPFVDLTYLSKFLETSFHFKCAGEYTIHTTKLYFASNLLSMSWVLNF